MGINQVIVESKLFSDLVNDWPHQRGLFTIHVSHGFEWLLSLFLAPNFLQIKSNYYIRFIIITVW